MCSGAPDRVNLSKFLHFIIDTFKLSIAILVNLHISSRHFEKDSLLALKEGGKNGGKRDERLGEGAGDEKK